MKRELERAIKAAGGSATALAKQLGVSPSTVRRWRKKGVPKRGNARLKLSAYKEQRKKRRVVERDKRKVLKEMLREARKQGLIPKKYTASRGKRVGAQTVGYRWTFVVPDATLHELTAKLEQLSGNRQYWQVVLQISQYGDGALYGDTASAGRYNTVNFSGIGQDPVKRLDMGKTLVEASASTPRVHGKRQLKHALEELYDEVSSDERVTTLIHTMTVYNYNLRTDQQRRDYETNQRRERRQEQWRKTKQLTKKRKKPGKRKRSKPKK